MNINKLGSEELFLYKFFILQDPEFFEQEFTLVDLAKNSNLSFKIVFRTLLKMVKSGHVSFLKCYLQESYIDKHLKKKEALIEKENRKSVASMSGGFLVQETKQRTSKEDKYCGLPKDHYDKLQKDGVLHLGLSDDEVMSNLEGVSEDLVLQSLIFKIKINEGLLDFMKRYSFAIINDEFADGRKLSYLAQKKGLATEIGTQIHMGFPLKGVRLNSTDVLFGKKNNPLQSPPFFSFLHTLVGMEAEGLITIRRIEYPQPLRVPVVITSELKDWHPLHVLLSADPKKFVKYYNEEVVQKDDVSTPLFRFVDGVFFRDGESCVLKFNEKTLEYNVLAVAFNKEFGEKIDMAVRGIDASSWKQLRDTVDRLNKKIAPSFGIGDFFEIIHSDKHFYRRVH